MSAFVHCMFTMELAYIQTWLHRDTSFGNFFFTTVGQIKLEGLQLWFVEQLILMKTLTFFRTVASVFPFPLLSASYILLHRHFVYLLSINLFELKFRNKKKSIWLQSRYDIITNSSQNHPKLPFGKFKRKKTTTNKY